jgi:hypothetical protein
MYSGVCYLVMSAIMCIVYKSVMYTEKICIYVYINIYIYINIYVCLYIENQKDSPERGEVCG